MRCKWIQLNSSRFAALCLACLLLIAYAPAVSAAEIGGDCGEGLSWSLEGGTLTITGSGDMTDFTEKEMAPWYAYREDILRVSLPDGLTNVGDLAFYDCDNLTAVVLPDSVEAVGDYAFAGCTDMTMLTLSSDLQTIGEAAFSDCYDLRSLDLPDGVESIGLKAFYRCESLTTVTVPDSVEQIGTSTFAYCKNLVRADIQASVDVLPEWMFYGCEYLTAVVLPDDISDVSDHTFRACGNLSSVYYDGESKSMTEIEQIFKEDANIGNQAVIQNGTPNASIIATSTRENEDGTVTQEKITVTKSDNASVATTVEHTLPADAETGGSYRADISVTVDSSSGWSEAQGSVAASLKDLNSQFAQNTESEGVNVHVYTAGTDGVDQSFVGSMAGRDVSLTVTTRDGSTWKIDCSTLDDTSESDGYDLRYTITAGSAELCSELETATAFSVRFVASAQVNAEVLIPLGSTYARQNATLFCRSGKELSRHQTVVVDGQGYAHFYLASVDAEAEYYIAMHLPVPEDDVILPAELLEEYNAIRYEPVQYEITGRTSSWGMNLGQVTWIMVGVLAFCVIGVGFTMYFLNKRKLKNGYIPDISDEDIRGNV